LAIAAFDPVYLNGAGLLFGPLRAVLAVRKNGAPALLLNGIAAVTAHELARGVRPQTATQRRLIEVDKAAASVVSDCWIAIRRFVIQSGNEGIRLVAP
jgi:hypothetical protein